MEVIKPIFRARNLTTLTRMQVHRMFISNYRMPRDGDKRMFPFIKRAIAK